MNKCTFPKPLQLLLLCLSNVSILARHIQSLQCYRLSSQNSLRISFETIGLWRRCKWPIGIEYLTKMCDKWHKAESLHLQTWHQCQMLVFSVGWHHTNSIINVAYLHALHFRGKKSIRFLQCDIMRQFGKQMTHLKGITLSVRTFYYIIVITLLGFITFSIR